jgi:hypothetical protein
MSHSLSFIKCRRQSSATSSTSATFPYLVPNMRAHVGIKYRELVLVALVAL